MTWPELRVSDLRQYVYCPRVVYYQYVAPVDRRATYKMEKGKAAQEDIQALEARRKLKKYGLEQGKRIFNPRLTSPRLALSGRPDLLIETDSALYPVDFKFTRGIPYKNHLYQLAGYALILEETRGKAVNQGFVYLIPHKNAEVYELTDELKQSCLATMQKIRHMIKEELFPESPPNRAKCADCEYGNYCRDIW